MGKNIEFKARVRDGAELNRRIRELPITGAEVLHQRDTFFRVKDGRLKLREHYRAHSELIRYRREDVAGARTSSYSRTRVIFPDIVRRVLGRLLGVAGEVSKTRHLYLIGTTRIHVDVVENLGDFVEIEVVMQDGRDDAHGKREADSLMKDLGIRDEDVIAVAYVDMLAADARH